MNRKILLAVVFFAAASLFYYASSSSACTPVQASCSVTCYNASGLEVDSDFCARDLPNGGECSCYTEWQNNGIMYCRARCTGLTGDDTFCTS
jgi:hypothetical protein